MNYFDCYIAVAQVQTQLFTLTAGKVQTPKPKMRQSGELFGYKKVVSV